MYTSSFGKRYPIGFVAVLAAPTLRADEIATSSRWIRAFFGYFLPLLEKSYSPSGET